MAARGRTRRGRATPARDSAGADADRAVSHAVAAPPGDLSMSMEPIKLTLGPYDRLEILREEKKSLTDQLVEVERAIRDILREVERQKFLQGLAPYYRLVQPPEGVHRLEQMEKLRATIYQALQQIEQTHKQVEAETPGATTPASAQPDRARVGGSRNRRFESFNADRRRPRP